MAQNTKVNKPPTPSYWLRLLDTLGFDIGEPAMFREFLRRRLRRRWARIPETNEDDFGTYLLAESQTVDDAHGLSSSYESVSPYGSMTPPTQTTETRSVFPIEVLSEGCASHGSSSTGSSDALSADYEKADTDSDSEKPDADSKNPDADSKNPDADSENSDGVCFAKYCDSCQEARMSSDYANRIFNLMTPLYCTVCRKERPSILFSYSSRRESSATRVCIGHQGYRPICPHLKVSFADIERWMIEGKQIEITCHEANCPVATATVCYRTSSQETRIKWTVTLDRHFSKGMVWDNCRTKLKELHQSFPAFLCPHFKTTPDRLFYPEHFERSSLARCSACENLICLRQGADVDRIESNWFLGFGASSMDAVFKEWIGALDPESYGHFDDQDTKCLTWCDDRYCITTCELLHFSALTSVRAIHSVSDCHEEEGRRVVSLLDWKVERGINWLKK
ncbi:hypothetical protein EDB80DRAFT_877101 [Ilyonectria destructans]|nr:hypothetical protein EDB80DRAFT_877101 [Ilyonectria destructans]